jgi:hypothetical protein
MCKDHQTVTGQSSAFFLDFEVDGHRVIIFPAWLEASLVGKPLDPRKAPSTRLRNTPLFVRNPCSDKPVLAAKKRLSEHLVEYLERLS